MLHRLRPKIKSEIDGIVLTMMLELYSAGCLDAHEVLPGFCYTDFPFFPWPTMYSDQNGMFGISGTKWHASLL